MKKIIALIVFSIFTASAFAQVTLDNSGSERKKRNRGYKRPQKIKRPK